MVRILIQDAITEILKEGEAAGAKGTVNYRRLAYFKQQMEAAQRYWDKQTGPGRAGLAAWVTPLCAGLLTLEDAGLKLDGVVKCAAVVGFLIGSGQFTEKPPTK